MPWNPKDYDIARGTTVEDCLAHAIHWFDQLTIKDAARYAAALEAAGVPVEEKGPTDGQP